MSKRVDIDKLPTGVAGLDEVLGGGLPELSFNLIAGGPGCGKTTLAHQIMFANASAERPGLYITVVGEPPLKMLRYQQQFGFFDLGKVGGAIRFLHLGDVLADHGLEGVLAAIVAEIQRTHPRLVVVDSFRSVIRKAQEDGEIDIGHFVQRLALQLTSWEATTFLVGEYVDHDDSNPLFSVADGIFWLYQQVTRSSVVRKLQVVKMRGQGQVPGVHTMTIDGDGLRVFPRTPAVPLAEDEEATRGAPGRRGTSGIPALDVLLGGGIPDGYSMLVAGPSGVGKTTLATQFAVEGAIHGEPAVIAIFERRPADYVRSAMRAQAIDELIRADKLRILYLRPLDLSIDETLTSVRDAVRAIGARRVVVDSLSGLEVALAPGFREDFREALYRTVGALTRLGVTVMMTAEVEGAGAAHQIAPLAMSFLTDGVIVMRYHEEHGAIARSLTVLKMRGSAHSHEVRAFTIDGEGIAVGPRLGAGDAAR